MYKCTECGCEYKEKPYFCDCGNDVFEDVQTVNPEPAKPDSAPKPAPAPRPAINQEPKIVHKEPEKKTFAEQYPQLVRFINSIDPISGGIFALCIILSIIVIFCVWNVDEENIASPKPSSQDESVIAKNIPPIDKIWNSTPPAPPKVEPKLEEVKPVQVIENVVKQVIPAAKKQVTTPKTTNKPQQQTAKKTASTPVQKTNNVAKSSTQKQTNTTKK